MKAPFFHPSWILPLFVLLALPGPLQAQFIFETNNGAITITRDTGPGGQVVIPSETNGLPVTTIGSEAFNCCASLTTITIPNTVTNIGFRALSSCTSLTSLTIGTNLTTIGSEAFSWCTSLTTVTIPHGVTIVGDGMFYQCSSLTNVTIPDSVTTIGGCAFYECTNLTNVTIGNSVTTIGYGAFQGCTTLNSIAIPNSVTNIDRGAFLSCTNLAAFYCWGDAPSLVPDIFSQDMNVIVYHLVRTTGWGTSFGGRPTALWWPVQAQFDYGTNSGTITITRYVAPLGFVTIPDTIDGKPVTTIAERAFYDCASPTNVTIPNTVTTIGEYAFASCPGLTIVTIPDSVTNIGDATFASCLSLTTATIGTNLTTIGNRAFYDCPSLTNVAIGNGVTTIGHWALAWCPSLTNLTIPKSVTNILHWTFAWCTSLRNIYFEGNAPTLGEDVFLGTDDPTVYYLPGTAGWGSTSGDRPTALWLPRLRAGDADFGIGTNQFGFTITWASERIVVTEATTSLTNGVWTALGTNTLVNGSFYFSEPDWTNYPTRFYRIRSP